MRILIIEDEIKAAEYLKKGLTNSGYQVETSNDGIDGLFIAQSSDFDLLILDVMLPGIDGWSFIRRFRERSQAPVLFLTARDAVEDRADSNLKCNTCNQVRFADVITSFVLVLSTTSA